MKIGLTSAAFICLLLVFSAASAACARPKPYDIDGRIIIPKLHENVQYVEGTRDDAAIPGELPVHYRSTNLPGEGQTIVISGHHFTHQLPGAAHGVFYGLDQLRRGDVYYITRTPRFGAAKVKFVVTSNRVVFCGHTRVGFYECPPVLRLMHDFEQTKSYLMTCVGDGYWRRLVTGFAEEQTT
jgi:LPXTG-site transpeptidase (sortase) family protein